MAALLPHTKKTPSYIWAACYNMLHNKRMAATSETPFLYMWNYILVFGCMRNVEAKKRTTFTAYLMAERLAMHAGCDMLFRC